MQQLTLETGSECMMRARRETGKSWLADQGHDIALGEAPCLGSAFQEIATKVQEHELSWSDAAPNEGYYFPSSMTTAGTLHILFNALEDAFGTSCVAAVRTGLSRARGGHGPMGSSFSHSGYVHEGEACC